MWSTKSYQQAVPSSNGLIYLQNITMENFLATVLPIFQNVLKRTLILNILNSLQWIYLLEAILSLVFSQEPSIEYTLLDLQHGELENTGIWSFLPVSCYHKFKFSKYCSQNGACKDFRKLFGMFCFCVCFCVFISLFFVSFSSLNSNPLSIVWLCNSYP